MTNEITAEAMGVENNFKRNCVKKEKIGGFLKIYLFCLWQVFVAANRLSLGVASEASVVVCGLLIVVDPLVAEHRLEHMGFSSCVGAQQLPLAGSRAAGSIIVA